MLSEQVADAAAAAGGAMIEAMIGRAITEANPTLRITSRRDTPTKGDR